MSSMPASRRKSVDGIGNDVTTGYRLDELYAVLGRWIAGR